MTEEQEIWKLFVSLKYKKMYISSLGKVKSVDNRNNEEKIIKLYRRGGKKKKVKKYLSFGYKNELRKKVMVQIHTIVAELFIGPKPTNLHQVDHKDNDPHNNIYTNLQWLTISENARKSNKIY